MAVEGRRRGGRLRRCGPRPHDPAPIDERGSRMTASAPTSTKIELTIEAGVATLALNRPEVRNAIDDEMRAQFNAAVERIANDDAVRAVVLTGKGSAFCAGGDISAMQERLKAPA